MDIPALSTHPSVSSPAQAPADDPLRQAAAEFEAAFVRQMLQYAGFAEAFGADSGASSEAMSSFLLDHLATEISKQGAFGLADTFYNELAARQDAAEETVGKRL